MHVEGYANRQTFAWPVDGRRYVDPELAHRTWSYNYDIPDIENELAALDLDFYVPKIWYAAIDGELERFVLVPSIPTMAFPEVDFVVVDRAGSPNEHRYERIAYSDAVAAIGAYERVLSPLGGVRTIDCGAQAIDALLPEAAPAFTKDQGVFEASLVDDPAFLEPRD